MSLVAARRAAPLGAYVRSLRRAPCSGTSSTDYIGTLMHARAELRRGLEAGARGEVMQAGAAWAAMYSVEVDADARGVGGGGGVRGRTSPGGVRAVREQPRGRRRRVLVVLISFSSRRSHLVVVFSSSSSRSHLVVLISSSCSLVVVFSSSSSRSHLVSTRASKDIACYTPVCTSGKTQLNMHRKHVHMC